MIIDTFRYVEVLLYMQSFLIFPSLAGLGCDRAFCGAYWHTQRFGGSDSHFVMLLVCSLLHLNDQACLCHLLVGGIKRVGKKLVVMMNRSTGYMQPVDQFARPVDIGHFLMHVPKWPVATGCKPI